MTITNESVRSVLDAAAPSQSIPVKPVSRREFLYYVWGASCLLLAGGTIGAAKLYLMPRNGGLIEGKDYLHLSVQDLPIVGEPPRYIREGRLWLSNAADGLYSLDGTNYKYPYDTFFKWSDANMRFEDPVYGTKFTATGAYIEGPRNRMHFTHLTQYVIQVITPSGVRETPAEGGPVSIEGATEIVVLLYRTIQFPTALG